MSIKFDLPKKLFNLLIVVFALITITPAMAEDNIISSVVISKSKSNPNGYELNIDSTKNVDYKMETDDDGSIYFDLKNSVLADDAGTVYDDVTNIDNVVVRQMDKNKVRIYVKGKNVENTELVFMNSLFDTNKQSKKIVINRPVNEYKSTSGYNDDDLESQEEIQEWNDNSFNFYHFASETLSGAKESALGIILIVASIFVFVFITIRTITSKISQDQEPLIGLNNTKTNLEDDIYSNTISKIQNKEINFNDITTRNQVIKNAQLELERAHNKYQEYLKNKYNNNPIKTKALGTDALKKTIALNQYKKNEKNPYLDQQVIKMDTINSYNKGNTQSFIPPRPKIQGSNLNTSPYIQKPSPKVSYTPKQNIKNNSGSLKFLESVSKIYEQSGREDLAIGLKKSITKSQKV